MALLGLKLEVGFTPFKLALLRLYKNSLLTKFLRRFGIENNISTNLFQNHSSDSSVNYPKTNLCIIKKIKKIIMHLLILNIISLI
jgi:hypothetical protein